MFNNTCMCKSIKYYIHGWSVNFLSDFVSALALKSNKWPINLKFANCRHRISSRLLHVWRIRLRRHCCLPTYKSRYASVSMFIIGIARYIVQQCIARLVFVWFLNQEPNICLIWWQQDHAVTTASRYVHSHPMSGNSIPHQYTTLAILFDLASAHFCF